MSNRPTQTTFDQAYELLNLTRESGVSIGDLQRLFSTGLLADLLRADDPTKIDRQQFRALLGLEPQVFPTMMGGPENADDIAAYLKGHRFFGTDKITEACFPIGRDTRSVMRDIVLIHPEKNFTEEEGRAILQGKGLQSPPYEYAFRFARQHGEKVSLTRRIILFPCRYVLPTNNSNLFVIYPTVGNRGIGFACSGETYEKNRFVLAGVRPE